MAEQHAANRAIGLFGGTFDPLHLGHLRMAEEVCEALSLSQMRLIPAAIPPHRSQPLLDAATRLSLVGQSIADNPRLCLDDREHRMAGKSYTARTVQDIRAQWPDRGLVMVLGVDAFNGFPEWYQPQVVLAQVNLVIVHRPQYSIEPAAMRLLAEHEVSIEALRQKLSAQPKTTGCIARLPTTALAISATELRAMIEQRRSIRYLVPEPVYNHFQSDMNSQSFINYD